MVGALLTVTRDGEISHSSIRTLKLRSLECEGESSHASEALSRWLNHLIATPPFL